MLTSIHPSPVQAFKIKRDELFSKWRGIVRSTSPANRPAAEKAVRSLYLQAGYSVPNEMLWTLSPGNGYAIAKHLLSHGGKNLFQSLEDAAIFRAREMLGERIGDWVFKEHQENFQTHITEGRIVRWLMDQIMPHHPRNSHLCGYGCHDGDRLAAYDFCLQTFNMEDPRLNAIQALLRIAESAGWWWPFERVCVITERPTVFQFSNATDPRLQMILGFADGWGVAVQEDVTIPFDIVAKPESLTVERIEKTENIEMRRIMIQRYGSARFLLDSGAKMIHQDDFGQIYRKDIPGDAPLVMVKVLNATPEPDGTFKDYFLRVPPTMKTAREAVAWTFGYRKAEDFSPSLET